MTFSHVKIENLWHRYKKSARDVWSLKGVDLDLHHGELVGLLGPSGCGKTTLLRLIAGFEQPYKGTISINGNIVASPTHILPAERRAVGMVFQDYALFPHLDAWSNVCFGLRKGQDISRPRWLMELLGLEGLMNRYPHELSGGQRQRLALARALAPGSSLVLLDEPFSNLDVEVRLRLRSELSKVLQTCGASGLLVTHDPQEALAICDRVAVLKSGQLHQCSAPCDLVHQPATPFVGRFVLQRNVLPVDVSHDQLNTPLGPIPSSQNNIHVTELMIDEMSIQITHDPEGEGLVQGREFLGSYWLLRVELGSYTLRIRQPLDNPLKVGDRCLVNFKEGQNGILFPGSVPCLLA
ncbi:ABC transporter ATP-binding protein [Prochlorococcus sp. MIT 1300]|uniref:ABC transporter ATP-binding protein n=1 Tax=Prochlorococcus sp. MIT 1300 TaxID=3096218 RepID=UPI002A74F016|nr:ABC transporter ATP-binding protein [Prochlorococcus sp. MIT 1300]